MGALRERRGLRRALAALAIALCAQAFLVAPAVHARHHALHGADHVHEAGGTRALHEGAHLAFHEAIDALGLGDAATAGTLAVDCALAAYTLAECTDDAHAPNFGDALAHEHPRPEPHGQGSLEHLSAALLVAGPILLPPPAQRRAAITLALVDAQRSVPVARTHAPRGPPAPI